MAEVLLIEDHRDDLELMAYLLRAFGHKPLSVCSGEAALGALEHRLPDLIVCDLGLPGMNGFEVAKEVKQSPGLKKIPLLAVTAFVIDRQNILAAGFDGYLRKPITPETFVAEIMEFLKPELRRAASPTPPPDAPAAPAAPPVAQNGYMVLAVDDRPANLYLVRSILEPSGHRVVTATGVQDGLARAREISPDVVLTDVHMGDGTGFELVKMMQADPALREIAWIVISATYLEMDPRAGEIGLNEANFIMRPIEPQALLAKIEACLAGKGSRAQSEGRAEHG